jgi:hypothetical protein
VISVACREGRCDQCQRCTGCSCHDGGIPEDFRERVERFRREAEAAEGRAEWGDVS